MASSNSLLYKCNAFCLAKSLRLAAYQVAPFVVEAVDKISNASTTHDSIRVVAQCRDSAGCEGWATNANLTIC